MDDKPKLDDNQKTATYIGWEPDEYDHVHKCWRDKGSVRAPDMSLPANYMKALRAVHKRDLELDRRERLDWEGLIYELLENGDHAAVKALAALYDKEHEND